ncbi:MAG: PilZ domain-containing protein [Phycisphaerales bacterium]|nr:PilZ domain-containing protein [Phycisphaerales bacterium]
MSGIQSATADAMVRRVIDRFIEETHRRCEWYGVPARRRERRFHRTWPLSVSYRHKGEHIQIGVALYNASPGGIAFLGPHPVNRDEIVRIQLFWHDDECPRVPAIVRHCTRRADAFLVGCEFMTKQSNIV